MSLLDKTEDEYLNMKYTIITIFMESLLVNRDLPESGKDN